MITNSVSGTEISFAVSIFWGKEDSQHVPNVTADVLFYPIELEIINFTQNWKTKSYLSLGSYNHDKISSKRFIYNFARVHRS